MSAGPDEKVFLFRYRPVSAYLWEELELSQWFACLPQKLNDPFDCVVDPLLALDRALATSLDDARLEKLRAIRSQLSKQDPREKPRGIVCFSLTRESHLMWSHYAAGHTGVCLTYEFPGNYFNKSYKSQDGSKKFFTVALAHVRYGDDAYFDWLNSGDLNDPIPEQWILNAAALTMVSKAASWSYEKEARLIMSNEGTVEFPHEFLKEVTFGLRTSDVHRKLIKKMVQRNTPEALFLDTVRNPQADFGLNFERSK